MSESDNVSTRHETQTVSESVPPAVVKEAEVKLKEMSRKAKERKSATVRKPPQKQSGSNLRLALIGGFGVGVLGILYLMFRKPKEEQERSDGPTVPPQIPVKQSPEKKSKPEFELNSF